ncbi:efflux RND transporter periplasmic adaptor subunit [Hydrogenophilus islandicus]
MTDSSANPPRSDPQALNPHANASSGQTARATLPPELAQLLTPQQRRWRRWGVWGVALVVVAAGLIGGWLQGRGGSAPIQYETDAARRATLVATVTATGSLHPTRQVDVGAEISGTVREVMVDFNDRVRRGQVLARLDTRRLEAQQRQLKAQLAAAQARLPEVAATLTEAETRLRRLQAAAKASDGKAVADFDLDSARAAVARARASRAQAEAQIAAIEAQLEEVATNLDKSVIRSPVDGVVLQRKVDPGQTIAASLQAPVLFVIAEDLAEMELLADVDEADVGRVRDGQPVRFRVDAFPDETFTGRVTMVRWGSEVVNGVVTYKTVIAVQNPELRLRPGMTATAEIETDRRDEVLTVANAALRYRPKPTVTEQKKEFSLLAFLTPRVPQAPRRPQEPTDRNAATLYLLKEGAPQPVTVRLGLSDGQRTEVVAVVKGELPEGAPLIVRERRSGSGT